jgi:predicted O-methyltransferase YrrM
VQIGEVFQNSSSHSRKITQLIGDSASFDFSGIGVSFDLIFIDGAHSTAYIKSDTDNAFKLVHTGSLIAWHDYKSSCPEVVKYLDRLAETCRLWHIQNTSLVIHKVE